MYKKKKYSILIVMLIYLFPNFVFASISNAATTNNIVGVQWVGVTSAACSLSISSGKASNYININCKDSDIDSAKFSIDLQQYKSGKWVSVKNWDVTKVVKNNNVDFNQSCSVEKGYNYRLKGTIKIYKSSTLVDTISVVSATKSY